MKAHVADPAARVYCVRITPNGDAPVVRLAGYPVDLVMSNGETYSAESGYEFSSLANGTTFAANSIDLDGIMQDGGISKQDLDSGVYDSARVHVFATSWAVPVEDEEPMGLFFFGKVKPVDDTYSVELMGAIDVLSQSTGRTYGLTCPWTLFDETIDGDVKLPRASRCTGPRGAPDGPLLEDYKVTGTLSAVTDRYTVTDTARSEVDDWFGEGQIRFTSGKNAGLRSKEIKSFSGGVITVHEAFAYQPAVGDTYEMIPGCRKRIDKDCSAKWHNSKNFGGFPDIPLSSEYAQVGRGG